MVSVLHEASHAQPGQTVVEATSGNTGIALAMVCAVKGYPFVATMSETFSIERRKLMRAYGAKVCDGDCIMVYVLSRGTTMDASALAQPNHSDHSGYKTHFTQALYVLCSISSLF